jgi:hypothetical protein
MHVGYYLHSIMLEKLENIIDELSKKINENFFSNMVKDLLIEL